MSESIRQLQPQSLWNHFANLNAVPRASKKEERVIAFAKAFGESLGLSTRVDEVGNVIIKKPATPGMENRAIVCLQSHLDMVHQKNAETTFDFATQGIQLRGYFHLISILKIVQHIDQFLIANIKISI